MSHNLYTDENIPSQEDLMEYACDTFKTELHLKNDKEQDFQAIIAIHSTKNGPALGGCRFINYPSSARAIWDAIRLARGMSYKAALIDLPLGGGKTVIIKKREPKDRPKLFKSMGQFIDGLNGRYITAVDSGTNMQDMDIIAGQTPYVVSSQCAHENPSNFTAQGVLYGIKAAVKFALKKDDLKGIRVAIQGEGNVGFYLGQALSNLGAQLTIADTDEKAISESLKHFKAKVVAPEEIMRIDTDVLAPCALGAVINQETVEHLKCPIIAGAANNQLLEPGQGENLHRKNILYAPDYVINAGGLIYAAHNYLKQNIEQTQIKIEKIYTTLLDIFSRSRAEDRPTSDIAEHIAQQKLR